jgi:outer membrane protein assembly factor BamB
MHKRIGSCGEIEVLRYVTVLIVIILLVGSSSQLLQSDPFLAKGQTTIDSWSSFSHDLQNTRFSSSSAPKMPNLLWEFNASFFGAEGVSISGGRVFVGSMSTQDFYCLNQTDGSLLWKTQLNGTTGYYASPVANEDGVIVGTTNGHIYYMSLTAGLKIWETTIPAEIIWDSSPVISNGRVFVGGMVDDQSNLYCLNLADGAKIWELQGGGNTPAVVDGQLFVGGSKVSCLNEFSRTKVWEVGIAGDSPAVVNGQVYVGSAVPSGNQVYCLNQTNGQQIWHYTCSGKDVSSPAVAYGNVFIVSKLNGAFIA